MNSTRTQVKHDQMVAEHKEEQQRSIQNLEKKVFEVSMPLSASPHEKETFRMSYRDAYDRAELATANFVVQPSSAKLRESAKSAFQNACLR